jgi:hypothetical protein
LKTWVHASLLLAASLAVATPLVAQPLGVSEPGTFRSEARLQFWHFGNFNQTSDPALEQDVRALGLELRSAWHPDNVPFDVYAHVNYLNWDADRDDSYGVRVGAALDGEVHDFNVFLERAENRATFDVGDTVSNAAVTTLSGEYSRRYGDWQPGVEATYERQRFDVAETGGDNDYKAAGANVRYRGFGWKFSPEAGFLIGERVSDNGEESYDEDVWYVQLVYVPIPRLYLSAQYRDRSRDYAVRDPFNRNFGRQDDRPQWSIVGSLKMTDRLTGLLYYSNEDAQSTRAGRDFQSDILILSLAVKL